MVGLSKEGYRSLANVLDWRTDVQLMLLWKLYLMSLLPNAKPPLKKEEKVFIAWVAYQYSLAPASSGVAYLKMPLVVAVEGGAMKSFLARPELVEKSRELKLSRKVLEGLVRLAYAGIQIRDPSGR